MFEQDCVLVVIDMQVGFSTAEKVVNNVAQEVELAVKNNRPVVVIEFANYGNTYQRIMKFLEGYDKFAKYTKTWNNGGAQVVEALDELCIEPKKIAYVGINRSYCVYETVEQCIKDLPECEHVVIKDATWCIQPSYGLDELRRLAVEIV